MNENELGNGLRKLGRKDLKGAVLKAFNRYSKDYGPDYPPSAYLMNKVPGGKTILIVDENDGGIYVDVYDLTGDLIASGSAGESDDFSWD